MDRSTDPALDDPRSEDARQAIARAIHRRTGAGEIHRPAALPSLHLVRLDDASGQACAVYEPCIALIAQGAKRVVLGADTFVYGAGQCLVATVNLPTLTQVLEASPQSPYLALALSLDLREVSRLILEGHLPPPDPQSPERAMATGRADSALMLAFQRLLELLGEPEHIPALAPLVQREILYRLLAGEHGRRLRQIVAVGSQSHQVGRAIEWLNLHYAQPLRIDDLAAHARMSASTFHHHFRALTAMSPLQYQKSLRLNEARRLMLADHLDAATAGYRVGYESPSQFSREYSRQFGAPPARDIGNLRAASRDLA